MILLEKILDLLYVIIKRGLKIIKGSDFVFESVELVDYKFHRVRLRRGGSYVKSTEWLAIINPKNKNDDFYIK